MEKVNSVMKCWLAKKLMSHYTQNELKRCKIEYSIELILTNMEKILVLLLVFGIGGKLEPFLCVFTVLIFTRMFLGGLHMKTYWGCLFFSVFYFFIAVMIGGNIAFPLEVKCLLFLVSIGMMFKFAPLPAVHNPHYSNKQKKGIKLKGVICLVIIFLFSLFIKGYSDYIVAVLVLQQIETILVMSKLDEN